MDDFDQFRKQVALLSANEIQRRIAEGSYRENPAREQIARQVVIEKLHQQNLDLDEKRDRVAKIATNAAWIAAIAAVVSAVVASIAVMKSS